MEQQDRDILIRIDERIKCLPGLVKKVDKHDRLFWVMGLLVSATGVTLLALFSGAWSRFVK